MYSTHLTMIEEYDYCILLGSFLFKFWCLFLVRYDATEDQLVADVSQQKRILKRRYAFQLFMPSLLTTFLTPSQSFAVSLSKSATPLSIQYCVTCLALCDRCFLQILSSGESKRC